jgi:hypothetical protein
MPQAFTRWWSANAAGIVPSETRLVWVTSVAAAVPAPPTIANAPSAAIAAIVLPCLIIMKQPPTALCALTIYTGIPQIGVVFVAS